MTACAVLLAIIGLSLSFFSAELASLIDINMSKPLELLVQLLGALYFGFAMLNWMAKGSAIGGIYNRPMALANFAHFFSGGMALIKTVSNQPQQSAALWFLIIAYVLYAILFGYLLFFYTPTAAKKFAKANA